MPGGYALAGLAVDVTVPDAPSPSQPIALTFELSAAQLPAGATHETLTIFRDGAAVPECPAGGGPTDSSPWCVKTRAALPGGGARIVVHTLRASVWAFGRDDSAPTPTITSGPGGGLANGEATFGFIAGEPVSRFECRMDAGGFSPCTSPTAYRGLGNGDHRFEVRTVDALGNVSAVAGRSFSVRLPGPPAGAPSTSPGGQPATPPPAQPRPPAQSRGGLSDAQLRALAARALRRSAVDSLRMSLGAARAFGATGVSRGRLSLKRGQKRASLFAVVCPVACRVATTQTLTVARRRHKLSAQRASLRSAGASVVVLRLGAKPYAALAKARRGSLAVTVEVTDGAGRRVTATRRIALSVRR
jgi:hypothetical protein